MRTIQLIIHDVRSAHNVGSLFRTADGLGVSKIYLTGYTGGPIDRFGRKDTKVSKVSLGAEDSVSWEKREIHELISTLQKEDVQVVALEQSSGAIAIDAFKPQGRVALIVGNEIGGIAEEILNACDAIIEIPMKGEKESLNVSNAGAIALYALSVS